MIRGFYEISMPRNEESKNYAPGSKERAELKKAISDARSKEIEIPMVIGGMEVKTGNLVRIFPPHDLKHTLGQYHKGDDSHVRMAIDAALAVREKWESMSWEQRASIFLKAAELIAGPYRARMNAATMLGQSKNAFQAEIDAICETVDFLRFNTHWMQRKVRL